MHRLSVLCCVFGYDHSLHCGRVSCTLCLYAVLVSVRVSHEGLRCNGSQAGAELTTWCTTSVWIEACVCVLVCVSSGGYVKCRLWLAYDLRHCVCVFSLNVSCWYLTSASVILQCRSSSCYFCVCVCVFVAAVEWCQLHVTFSLCVMCVSHYWSICLTVIVISLCSSGVARICNRWCIILLLSRFSAHISWSVDPSLASAFDFQCPSPL